MIFFILILICASQVSCQTKEPCELEDVTCVTGGAQSVYQDIVSGLPDIGVDPSDPIHVDLLEAHLQTLNYTLSDTYWRGLKDCRVEKLQLVFKDKSWHMYLICPLLIMESNYFIYGDIGSIHNEGEGKCKLIHDNYHIGIRANMERYADADGNDHVNLTNFILDILEVRGFVNYSFENLFYGDAEKSESMHKILNDNWKKVSIATQEPALYSFIGKLVENINKYLKAVSINKMFYKSV